jgi:hypothetical protein
MTVALRTLSSRCSAGIQRPFRCLLCLQEAAVLLNDVQVLQVVHTVPAIDFEVTAAAASADGHQLLLVGATRQVSSACFYGIAHVYVDHTCTPQQQMLPWYDWMQYCTDTSEHMYMLFACCLLCKL